VDKEGVRYSPLAQGITTAPAGTSSRLYNHCDFLTADNSRAGQASPGQVGSNMVSNTLVPWVLSRATGTTPVPGQRWGSEVIVQTYGATELSFAQR
jgi:hypothetical protein